MIENNEIFGWPAEGVEAIETPADFQTTPRITRNFIHNNVQCNLGYGVVLSGNGFARIDRNVFNYNRHDVAGSGQPGQGYLAERNLVLTSGPTCGGNYNQHFDMHGTKGGTGGTAGRLIEIRRNTIRGAQRYAFNGRLVRPGFELRGTPQDQAVFAENAVAHGAVLKQHTAFGGTVSSSGAVRVKGASATSLLLKKKLVLRANQTCMNTAKELAVGDFNGDGRADVFQAVGTLWVYSPSGQREWFFLKDSNLRLARLGLGDFDGDRKTDVFSQEGARWLVSTGGTSAPRPLPAGSSIDVKGYRFGDFDGDGKTDVFRASGSRFFFSSAGATGWQPLAASRLSIGELRFGDFDGDGKTDVFSLANNQWSVSDGGNSAWRRLNKKLSSSLRSLAFADFNGDRRTDVARSSSGNWQVSWGGATAWQTLQFRRSESLAAGMLFGDFTGDGRADVLQHASIGGPSPLCGARDWQLREVQAVGRRRSSARPLVVRRSALSMVEEDPFGRAPERKRVRAFARLVLDLQSARRFLEKYGGAARRRRPRSPAARPGRRACGRGDLDLLLPLVGHTATGRQVPPLEQERAPAATGPCEHVLPLPRAVLEP